MSLLISVLFQLLSEEPFGLVPCEAQAAGAPVVGYARGALPEVVADRMTGWLVPEGDVAAAVAAVERVGEIAHAACRAWVAERFNLGAMLNAHERVYREMVGKGRNGPHPQPLSHGERGAAQSWHTAKEGQ